MDKLNAVLDFIEGNANKEFSTVKVVVKRILQAVIDDFYHFKGRNAAMTKAIKELQAAMGRLS